MNDNTSDQPNPEPPGYFAKLPLFNCESKFDLVKEGKYTQGAAISFCVANKALHLMNFIVMGMIIYQLAVYMKSR